MGRVISFEQHTVARLRAAESAREDLIAFAHGHSGAVASIHHAVLAAMDATSFDDLMRIVSNEWPSLLGVDHMVLALCLGDKGFRIDRTGVHVFAQPIIRRAVANLDDVELRAVDRGHALFGDEADGVRAEALVRIENEPCYPYGLLALGQSGALAVDSRHGGELLLFLGMSLAAMMRRWTTPTD